MAIGYPLITAEGAVPTWGAAGFYATLIAALQPNAATLNINGEALETTPIGGTTYDGLTGLRDWEVSIDATGFTTPRLGNIGTATWGSLEIFHIDSWEVNWAVPALDITSVASTGPVWRSFRPGIPTIGVSLSARVDSNTLVNLPTAPGTAKAALSSLALRYGDSATDETLTGQAYLRTTSINAQRGALQLVTIEGQFFGDVTPAGTGSFFGSSVFGIPLWSQLGATTNTLLTLTTNTGQTYAGDAFYKAMRLRVAVGEPVQLSVTAQGSSTLTPA